MEVIPIRLEGDVRANTDLADLIISSVRRAKKRLKDKDVLVIAHKIVSKAEGRVIDLSTVEPSGKAIRIAKKHHKDPKVVELILRESKKIVKSERGIIITETSRGLVCANSGVDQSNVNGDRASLLPEKPDISAERIRRAVRRKSGKDVVVIISDTFGRPFREGQVNVAIGVSGMRPIKDYRGSRDMFGKELKVTEIAVADEIASAAELVMGKADHVPLAIVRGLIYDESRKGSASELIRERKNDLFR